MAELKSLFEMKRSDFESACRWVAENRMEVTTYEYYSELDQDAGVIRILHHNGDTEAIKIGPAPGRPRILMYAGPNGSGKSTFRRGLPTEGVFVNSISKGVMSLEVGILAEKFRELLMENSMNFTFETVLSKDRNIKLLQRAREKGYEVFTVFLLTNDPKNNIERVRKRYEAGGHDAPVDKIMSRYEGSLKNIPALIAASDHMRIIDNTGPYPNLIFSSDGQESEIMENNFWSRGEIENLIKMKR